MKVPAALYAGLKLVAWTSTFTIVSLWLEVNSRADQSIQRMVGTVSALAWRTLEALLT